MYSTHVLSLFSAFMQDRVPAFSPEKAKVFIEKEMGCSIDVVYKEFEERPIAAASLGQVFNPKLCYKKILNFVCTYIFYPVPLLT